MFIELAIGTEEKILVVGNTIYCNKSRVQKYNIFKFEKSWETMGYFLKSQLPMQMAQQQ